MRRDAHTACFATTSTLADARSRVAGRLLCLLRDRLLHACTGRPYRHDDARGELGGRILAHHHRMGMTDLMPKPCCAAAGELVDERIEATLQTPGAHQHPREALMTRWESTFADRLSQNVWLGVATAWSSLRRPRLSYSGPTCGLWCPFWICISRSSLCRSSKSISLSLLRRRSRHPRRPSTPLATFSLPLHLCLAFGCTYVD